MARFDGSLMEEGRFFILEAEVSFIINKKKHSGMLSLFSDILLFARNSHYSNKLKYKRQVRLTYATLVNDPETEEKNAIKIVVRTLPESGNNYDQESSFLISFTSAEQKEKWVAHIQQVLRDIALKKVFGAPLSQSGEGMPRFLQKVLSYLYKADFSEENMSCVSGSDRNARKIKQDADSGRDIEFSSSVIAASVLKLYLRELPETIITSELRCWFLELAGPEANAEPVELNPLYRAVISQLPYPNKSTLKELIFCFSQIVNRNKVTPHSFGEVFGGCLFYGKGTVEPAELQWSNNATEYMVQSYNELFGT